MAKGKFASLVHYVIHECTNRLNELDDDNLNKILWFSDALAYQQDGCAITGESYVKRQGKPVPKLILQTLETLEKEGNITALESINQSDDRNFIANIAAPPYVLSCKERAILSAVLDPVLGNTANAVGGMGHDSIWNAAEEGEGIPLFATMVGYAGEITAEVVDWATCSYWQRVVA